MPVDLWMRNPQAYVRECVEVGALNFVFDRGVLVKKSIDANRFFDLHVPHPMEWRCLAVGDQGAALLDRKHTMKRPAAVYPVWEYAEDDIEHLEYLIENPVGLDESLCRDTAKEPDERPVLGQEHIVVVSQLPPGNHGPGRRILKLLVELQEENPQVTIFVHGLYGFSLLFGMGFKAGDWEARTHAQQGTIVLPNGKQVKSEHDRLKFAPWITLLGMLPADLTVPRNRCIYNIKSAQWAAEHYLENVKFRVGGRPKIGSDGLPVKIDDSLPVTFSGGHSSRLDTDTLSGDKLLCDLCSLQSDCRYFRSGGVCSIPGSEPAPLAKLFKSRNADDILEGLGTLIAANSHRLARGMSDEDTFGELDPEVTRIINTMFNHGVKLAKLRNPMLARAGAAQVNVGIITGQQGGMAPVNVLTGHIVRELEAKGIAREDITPDMVKALLEPDVVEAEVVEVSGEHGSD